MALLTNEELKELKVKGIYVKEKCDICQKPILEPLKYRKKIGGREVDVCCRCATGETMGKVVTKSEGEVTRVAKEKKDEEKKGKKIGGVLVAGTAIADLYLFLEDEKKHSLADTKKAIAKHSADKMGRIRQLARYGKQKGLWAVVIDDEAETVQMKLGKGQPASAEKKKEQKEEPAASRSQQKRVAAQKKAAPEKKKSKEEVVEEPEEGENGSTSKGQAAVARLVRQLLKNGKDWTKNTVADSLKEEHGIDPKRTMDAIASELKNGGLTAEDGVLALT